MTPRRFLLLPVALVVAYWLALAAWLFVPTLARAVRAEVHLALRQMDGG